MKLGPAGTMATERSKEEENAARNRACIVTEGRSQPLCLLCSVDIVDTPKAIKAHLKSKPHKAAMRSAYPELENDRSAAEDSDRK